MFDVPKTKESTFLSSREARNTFFELKAAFGPPDDLEVSVLSAAITEIWTISGIISSRDGPISDFPIRPEDLGRQYRKAKTVGLISAADCSKLGYLDCFLTKWDDWLAYSSKQKKGNPVSKLLKKYKLF